MRTLTILLLAALLAFCVSASDVVVATDSNIDEVIASHDFVILKFFAPWCGHCKKLAPEYEAAATQLKGIAVLAELDATESKKTAEKYEIRGYPTIKVFRGGALQGDYEAGRTTSDIVKYVKGNSGPATTSVTSMAEIEALKKNNEMIVVAFMEAAEGTMYDAFVGAAKKMRGVATFVISTGERGDEKPNTIVIFKSFDDARTEFVGDATSEPEILKFVGGASIHLFSEMGPDNYRMYMERKLPIGWLFVIPGKEETKAAQDAVSACAKEFQPKLSLVWIDASKYGQMAQRVGLKADQFPGFAVDHEGTHFAYTGEFKEAGVRAFLSEFVEGKLSQTIRSEPVPEAHTVDGLTTVVGNTFKELILDESERDILLEFYAPWCGHCKKLAPIYDKVAAALKDVSTIRIAKMDATNNDFDQKLFQVQGFPTLYFVPKGTKQPIPFEGERTFEGIIAFLKEKATTPFEVQEGATE